MSVEELDIQTVRPAERHAMLGIIEALQKWWMLDNLSEPSSDYHVQVAVVAGQGCRRDRKRIRLGLRWPRRA